MRRVLDNRSPVASEIVDCDAQTLVVPEVFSPTVAKALPSLLAAVPGPRVAIFHDAIALKFPELTPAKTVARFPAYLIELLAFDGIAAVSEDSRASLVDYWRWLDRRNVPPVTVIPLGTDTHLAETGGEFSPPSNPQIVLSVGTIEGRKNHLALLDACERLWREGQNFSLHVIGLAQSQTGREAITRIAELKSAGRLLRYDGPVGDAALAAAYRECAFTVYPSLMEGFGLPVLESVAHGRPCICSSRGALGESARAGGCVALPRVDAAALATAMRRLLTSPAELAALTTAARARTLRTWSDYVADLNAWMTELARR